MRGAAEPVGVLRRQRAAQLVEHRRRFLEKRVDELEHELGAGVSLSAAKVALIDRRLRSSSVLAGGRRFSASTSRSTRIGLVR